MGLVRLNVCAVLYASFTCDSVADSDAESFIWKYSWAPFNRDAHFKDGDELTAEDRMFELESEFVPWVDEYRLFRFA